MARPRKAAAKQLKTPVGLRSSLGTVRKSSEQSPARDGSAKAWGAGGPAELLGARRQSRNRRISSEAAAKQLESPVGAADYAAKPRARGFWEPGGSLGGSRGTPEGAVSKASSLLLRHLQSSLWPVVGKGKGTGAGKPVLGGPGGSLGTVRQSSEPEMRRLQCTGKPCGKPWPMARARKAGQAAVSEP